MRNHIDTLSMVVLAIVLAITCVNCRGSETATDSRDRIIKEDRPMVTVAELERLLSEGNWLAVDRATDLGESSWPAIQNGMTMADYRSRQIAMACAGRIGGNTAGIVLAQGLSDQNVNVRLTAAAQLSVNPPVTAKRAVLETLSKSSETDVREMLALAAGYLPGERTMELLRSLSSGNDALAVNARMALAKLGDADARAEIVRDLADSEPNVRYEALGQLRYINDIALAEHARVLLSDKDNARLIGPQRRLQYRRVCDQAVDTLVYLLKLSLPFETSVEKIYSDEELAQVSASSR